MKLSIIIPSVNDPCLQRTIDDIAKNAKEEYEIIVVFDGYGGNANGAKCISLEERHGLRFAVNRGVEASRGKYIIKVDEHCRFDEGFDTKLLRSVKDNWIVVPRRYDLDIEKWEVIIGRSIDYERLAIDNPDKIGGIKWRSRARQRKHILIDETMVFQGSFYCMSKKHWDWLGGLHEEGYGPFAQEAIELSLKTWLGGGKVMVNKKTWYAHKSRQFKRIISPWGVSKGNKYSKDFWLNNRWDKRMYDIEWLMRSFGL